MSERPTDAEAALTVARAHLEELQHEIARLIVRIAILETELMFARGTPGSSPTSETLTEYTHDVPPDAPR